MSSPPQSTAKGLPGGFRFLFLAKNITHVMVQAGPSAWNFSVLLPCINSVISMPMSLLLGKPFLVSRYPCHPLKSPHSTVLCPFTIPRSSWSPLFTFVFPIGLEPCEGRSRPQTQGCIGSILAHLQAQSFSLEISARWRLSSCILRFSCIPIASLLLKCQELGHCVRYKSASLRGLWTFRNWKAFEGF